MENICDKFKNFELINNAELPAIRGGKSWCNWIADMHTCISVEVTCTSAFKVTECLNVNKIECGGFKAVPA